jgi:tetratricopeptide (TPR) repeat protein
VAIGGMGKSALTWKWFNDIVPNEMPNLAGRMWWSFYESDAHYENFIIRALAYVSGQSEKAVRELKSPEREDQLWRFLDQKPFLLVLDGVERILIAYARMDAAHMLDEDLDEQTANRLAGAQGLHARAGQSFVGRHQLRCAVDHRAGQFLRRLARVKQSRILVTTRLYPAELQTDTGNLLPGCFSMFLAGLKDDDALNLWREFRVSGSREALLPLFRCFGNHPLLLRALAGEVAEYKPAPGNFDQWHKDNPGFSPAALPLEDGKAHVLEYALRGLGETQRQALHTLAAFRMPAGWDTLRALLVGENKPCAEDRKLDAVLTELEDRGLMGWDKKGNRYDLHPVVRGVVWAALAPAARQNIYRELQTYFAAAPRPPEWGRVERLEDLTPGVELFDKLIGLERYDEAFGIFRDHLNQATLHRLSASRLRVEMLERLFPDGVEAQPRLEKASDHSFLLNALALAYRGSGEPGRATVLFKRAAERDEKDKFAAGLRVKLHNLAEVIWITGQMREAEAAARQALAICKELRDRVAEAVDLEIIGMALSSRGDFAQSRLILRRSAAIFAAKHLQQSEGREFLNLAQLYLWSGQPNMARPLAERAWEMVRPEHIEENVIFAFRLLGEAALFLGDMVGAEERLNQALTRARAVNLVQEELCALSVLADLDRRRQQHESARKLLEQVWAPAERGPFPLRHADALNVLTQIEREQGHPAAAIAAATKAYTLAWCDGPPYAYFSGLAAARKHLQELGAPEPRLPPFNESKFKPMPEVELNPQDKYWVDPVKWDDKS